jgi:hypothetical protein
MPRALAVGTRVATGAFVSAAGTLVIMAELGRLLRAAFGA